MNDHAKDTFRYQYLYAYGNWKAKSVLSSRYQGNGLDRQMADEYWERFINSYPTRSGIEVREPEYKPVNLDDYL